MVDHELRFPSLSALDARTRDLEKVGGGEGFSVFTAMFDGRPAVVVDEGTLADLLPEDEQGDTVVVHWFETEEDRRQFIVTLRLSEFGHAPSS